MDSQHLEALKMSGPIHLRATLELNVRQCREGLRQLAAVMDEQFPGWTSAEIPAE